MNGREARGLATRQGILQAATQLFAERGYAGASIEAVLVATGLSRGALYHHFDGKAALFEAVVEALEADVCRQLIARSAGARDAVRAVMAGGEAFLALAQDPAVRQILLTDGPSVLGWRKWRELQTRHRLGLVGASLARAAREGVPPAARVDIYAHILLAAFNEAALAVARADDRETAAAEAAAAMATLVAAIFEHDSGG